MKKTVLYKCGICALFLALALILPGVKAKAATVTLSNGYSSARITDNSFYTTLELKAGEKITISDAGSVKHLYIMWDLGTNGGNNGGNEWFYGSRGLNPWKLYIDGEEYEYGQKGFIQEYVQLPKQGQKLEIVVTADVSLCELYLIETEEVPDYVHIWDDPCEEADVLLISAHSDDEVLFFGGTLPYYANEKKLKVQVAYFTYHNQKIRAHEALNAIYYCGVRNYPVFGEFQDQYASSLAQAEGLYNYNKAQAKIVELYRRFKPNVVLTHDPNGEYGHGVHMLVSDLAQKAVKLAADSAACPELTEKYGTWEVKKLYLHLYEKNQIRLDWEFNLESYGGVNCWDVIAKAFSLYDSQMQYYKSSLNNIKNHAPSAKYDCRLFGLYSSTVGLDVKKDDFLENIKPVEYKTYKEKYRKVRSITHNWE